MENTMDGECKQPGRFMENGNKKDAYIQDQKGVVEIFSDTHKRKKKLSQNIVNIKDAEGCRNNLSNEIVQVDVRTGRGRDSKKTDIAQGHKA